MEVNTEECPFKPGPSHHLWHWHDFRLFSHQPATVNVQTWKNHYSYKKVVYLPDRRWLITVEAVSMATSSLAAKGKWDFHPISFEMALVFSERGELDLLEQDFCCKTQKNSANPDIFTPLSTLWPLIIHQEKIFYQWKYNYDTIGCGVWCSVCLLSILTFLITEDPRSVTLCPVLWPTCTKRCLRVIPEAYGKKPMPIY